MVKKRDFSRISDDILKKKDKPSSLSELIGVHHSNIDDSNSNNSQSKKINTNDGHTTKATRIVRECISMNQFDIDMINEIATKSAAEGQRTSKSDIYRASVKYFSKLSPSVIASKIKEIRRGKKTHN